MTVVMITIDRDMASTIISLSDGRHVEYPLTEQVFEDSSRLVRLHFTPESRRLMAVTDVGDKILFELPIGGGIDQQQGRLIVYLDQNHWSTISRARFDPARVPDAQRTAAQQMLDWFVQERLIFPLSSGHMYETGKLVTAEKRYWLGLTILQLSRGWQLCDPLQVRRDEFRDAMNALQGREARPTSAVRLDPNTIHSPARDGYIHVPTVDDSDPEMDLMLQALVSATSTIDTILDAEHLEAGPDTGWVAETQRFHDWLCAQSLDSQQKRKLIDVHIMHDLRQEIAEAAALAGMSDEDFSEWLLKCWARDVSGLPALGLYRELLHERHLNSKGRRWESNDLTDMVYLSCAAGYSDFVVCEKSTAAALRQGVRRLGRTVQIFHSLPDAVAAIGQALEERTQ